MKPADTWCISESVMKIGPFPHVAKSKEMAAA
jgi:hypothetical protein